MKDSSQRIKESIEDEKQSETSLGSTQTGTKKTEVIKNVDLNDMVLKLHDFENDPNTQFTEAEKNLMRKVAEDEYSSEELESMGIQKGTVGRIKNWYEKTIEK